MTQTQIPYDISSLRSSWYASLAQICAKQVSDVLGLHCITVVLMPESIPSVRLTLLSEANDS